MRRFWAFSVTLVLLFASSGFAEAGHKEAEKALKTGDYAKAMAEFEQLASSGDAKAQSQLALMYARGQGVATNYKKATELFRKAAEQGDAEGAYGLGIAYGNGDTVPADKPQAAKWLRQAAEKGHARAAYLSGIILIRGDGVPKAPEEGIAFLNQARRGNDMDAALFQRNMLDTAGDQLKVLFEGGFGDSVETAVRIAGPANKQEGAPAQRKFVELLYPGWHNYKQSLLPQGGKLFDAFELTGPNGKKQTVYFDVTPWFGAGEEKK